MKKSRKHRPCTLIGPLNQNGNRIGVVLISQDEAKFPSATKFGFECTNNIIEYEACFIGFKYALDRGAKNMEVDRDLALVIQQVNNNWRVKDAMLQPYDAHMNTSLHFLITSS